MNSSNWDDLILGLERALSAAKRLRAFYEVKLDGNNYEIPQLPEGLSVKAMMVEIARANGGKLVVKEAISIITANLLSDRDYARNSIYANLGYWQKQNLFRKLSKGKYQLVLRSRE